MLVIKLKPFGKNFKGTYTFHNGSTYVEFTNERKYRKALKKHEEHLQNLVREKERQIFDGVIEQDLSKLDSVVSDLKRLEMYLRHQGENTLHSINAVLIPHPIR